MGGHGPSPLNIGQPLITSGSLTCKLIPLQCILLFMNVIRELAKSEKVLVDVGFRNAWQQSGLGSKFISKGLRCWKGESIKLFVFLKINI